MNKKELQERKRRAEEELTAIAERYAEEALAANVKSLEAAVASAKKPKKMPEYKEIDANALMNEARQVVMRNAAPVAERFRWTIPQPREDIGAQARAVQQRIDAEDRMRHAERMLTEVIGGAF